MPRTKRQQLQLHQQASNLVIDDDEDDSTELDNLDYHRGRERPAIVYDFDHDTLSPYIIDRLAAAREKAMERYREVWENKMG